MRRTLGAGQGIAVDVVDEQQYVAAFVAEVLGDAQTGQGHAQPVARRLVHLAVDQRHLVQHVRILHLMIEVVAFAGPLAHAGEHRITGVLDGDIADQLHHVDGLAHAGAAEQAHLATLGERTEQVDDLDTGFQQFGRARLILITGRWLMDGAVGVGLHRPLMVNRYRPARS
jgi:hypothetical protein